MLDHSEDFGLRAGPSSSPRTLSLRQGNPWLLSSDQLRGREPSHCSIKENQPRDPSSFQLSAWAKVWQQSLRPWEQSTPAAERHGQHVSFLQTSMSLHSDLSGGSKRGEPVPRAAGSRGPRPFPALQLQPEAGAGGGTVVPPRSAVPGHAEPPGPVHLHR